MAGLTVTRRGIAEEQSAGPYRTAATYVPPPTGVVATDYAAVQAAATKAAGGKLVFPAGTYQLGGNVVALPAGYHTWEGTGFNQTKLVWAVDQGTLGSVYAIDTSAATGFNALGIQFQGPGAAGIGVVNANLSCFKTKASGVYERCFWTNFYAGTAIASNHEHFSHCFWSGNYINRRYLPTAQGDGTKGNQTYHGCDDLSAGFACTSVANTNDMDGTILSGCYFGHAPYGIYGEGSRANGTFLFGAHFVKCEFESIGNAYVYDSDASGQAAYTTFDDVDCGPLTPAYNIASEPNDYCAKFGSITDVQIRNNQSTFAYPAKGAGTLSPYAPSGGWMFVSGACTELQWEDAHFAIDSSSYDAPTGFTATAVASGGTFTAATYFWRVTALNSSGETIGSVEKSAAIVLNGSANLQWNRALNVDTLRAASSYKVYRATASNGQTAASSLVATVADPGSGTVVTYTDTGAALTTGAIPMVNTTTSRCVLQLGGSGYVQRCSGTYRKQPIRWAARNGAPQVGRFDALVCWDFTPDSGNANTAGKLIYQKLTGFPILGVALHGDLNASANVIPLATRGAKVPVVTRAADAAIGNLTYVKADASNAGSCATATLGTDRPIMGVVIAPSAGSLVEIDFSLTT